MDHEELVRRFEAVSTANVADACLRAGVQVRCGHPNIGPVIPGSRLAGRVLPAQHFGSTDIFLEAFTRAEPGDVLVVDNTGRDEACVGDLVVLEAESAGIAGIVIWGLHRDTADIKAIGLPVFSQGHLPTGPLRLDPPTADALTAASIGDWTLTSADVIFGDDDGVIAVPAAKVGEVMEIAETIRNTERGQADLIKAGVTLRSQLRFDEYLAARERNPALTFRDHLSAAGGAIEA
ncbi:MAG TPA: RraA family protein [Streptosporangiaceae bacterium]|nr:RraA family protein [Streptosporangiaceae bacterium]